MEDFEKFLRLAKRVRVDPGTVPEYEKALSVARVLGGEQPESVFREVPAGYRLRRAASTLARLVEDVQARGLAGLIPDLDERLSRLDSRRNGIAQMILGRLTERRFEQLAERVVREAATRGRALSIEPKVEERTTTDYLLKNGTGSAVCRINTKFHGTLFRGAADRVGLVPEDCFALATYKIFAALERQNQDRFPYVFFVLSIPGLTAASIAVLVPDDLVWLLSVVSGRRVVEEAIADELGKAEYEDQFQGLLRRMEESEFRVMSAAKAFGLLRDRLFARVYALRVPRFAQTNPRAEVDMHFSISQDLTPVATFLEHLYTDPLHVFTVRLDRGEL